MNINIALMCANAQNVSEWRGMIASGVYLLPDKHSKSLARQRQSVPGLFYVRQRTERLGAEGDD